MNPLDDQMGAQYHPNSYSKNNQVYQAGTVRDTTEGSSTGGSSGMISMLPSRAGVLREINSIVVGSLAAACRRARDSSFSRNEKWCAKTGLTVASQLLTDGSTSNLENHAARGHSEMY